MCIGVLLDESAIPGIQSAVRHAVHAHNNATSVKSASSRDFKLDKYEKIVDTTNSLQLSQACTLIVSLSLSILIVAYEQRGS